MDKIKLKALLILGDTSIKQAMQKLNVTAERILFVADGHNRLTGALTDGDIRRAIVEGMQLTTAVKEIMKTGFISVNENHSDLKQKAIELMKRMRISQIPVVSDDGVITDVISWHNYIDIEYEYDEKPFLQNPVVIMAGGKGTRLDPFTKILPKPLIPLGNKPVIEKIMNRFYKNGFCKFILILNYKKEMIKIYLNDNNLPYDIEFVEEKKFYGTAGGLSLLRKQLNETFIVSNCDTILKGNYADFFNWHKDRQNLMTIVGTHKEMVVPYGVLKMSDGCFSGIDEKPEFDLFINTGTYVFEPDIFDFIDENKHTDMDGLIDRISRKYQKKIGVYPHWGGWFDMGQWSEYRKSLELIEGKPDDL